VAAAAGGPGPLRRHALEIFRAAVVAAEPARAVRQHLTLEGDELVVHGEDCATRVPLPAPGRGRVLVVGAGKGSAPMARALEELLGGRIATGVVCVKDGHGCPLERVQLREASHPVPDQRGVEAGAEILELAAGAGADDLVLAVLSGGGSALLAAPAEGVSLGDLQALTDLLLSCGASIDEINTLRKHLSRVKGGRLGVAAHPARVVNLALSDVVGDRLDVIASGPFSADPGTFADAREILERYGLWSRVPAAVRTVLDAGLAGRMPETPKPGAAELSGVTQVVVGSNRISLDAAAVAARDLGYRPLVLSSQVQGEAREVARVLAAVAKECRATGTPLAPPAAVLAGGETTVTLRGGGRGGRNQELALALALELEGWEGVVGLSGGTDGSDGPTDAAGGLALADSVARGAAAGVDARACLAENDSYRYLDAVGDLIRTGPTRTNVMDVQVLLVAPAPS
jgi:hydroxypyruvate reductase